MRWLFVAFRFYPYWALPLGLLFFEMGVHFRRRKMPIQWACWSGFSILFGLTLLWFVFRGDLNSDEWARALLFRRH
jgi:hypothetical protein